MGKETDIRIVDVQVAFSDETFRIPLKLSSGSIERITYAEVKTTVVNRKGGGAVGIGGILLSDLWAFPGTDLTHEAKDRSMRDLMLEIKGALLGLSGWVDPFQLAHAMEQEIQSGGAGRLPLLSSLVCWSPFDAAIHDGWAKAANRSAYDMYTAEFLNEDLSVALGEAFKGKYPGHYLSDRPRRQLQVQHVVGAGDPLRRSEAAQRPDDDEPLALEEWIERDGVAWLKLKLKGVDVEWDLARTAEVYSIAEQTLSRCGIRRPVLFEIDANEACPMPEPTVEYLRKLRERAPAVFEALQYVEQPTPRRLADYTYTLHEISRYKPVLVDESLDDLGNLPLIDRQGWSGVALKTCKGHSHALIAYCYARSKNWFITLQDLTNPGIALMHSAALCSRLSLSIDAFEYNSRQYIPRCQPHIQAKHPDIFRVADGSIGIDSLAGIGLY